MKTIKVYRYVGGFVDSYRPFNYTLKELIPELQSGAIYIKERLNMGVINELRLSYVRLGDILEVLKYGNNRE